MLGSYLASFAATNPRLRLECRHTSCGCDTANTSTPFGRGHGLFAYAQGSGVWPYTQMRDDPPFREVPVPLEPASTQGLIWDRVSRTAQILRRWQNSVTFDVPDPTKVAGVRMKFRYTPAPGSMPLPNVRIIWRKPGQQVAPPEQVYKISPTGDRANWRGGTFRRIGADVVTMHAWIGSTIDQIEIRPNDVGQFTLEELVLLFPSQ